MFREPPPGHVFLESLAGIDPIESGRSGASFTSQKNNASATHFFALSPKPIARDFAGNVQGLVFSGVNPTSQVSSKSIPKFPRFISENDVPDRYNIGDRIADNHSSQSQIFLKSINSNDKFFRRERTPRSFIFIFIKLSPFWPSFRHLPPPCTLIIQLRCLWLVVGPSSGYGLPNPFWCILSTSITSTLTAFVVEGSNRLVVNSYQQGSKNQHWHYNKQRQTIDNDDNKNKVFDVYEASTDTGAQICAYDYNGGGNQQWKIEPV